MIDAPLIHPEEAASLADGSHGNPFAVLGMHETDGKLVVRVFRPKPTASN